jgi:hypothetical protein
MARSRHVTSSATAPVGGLNVRDAINAMPSIDAIELVNWIPQQYGVRSRKGYSEWAIGLGAPCESILSFQPDQDDISAFKLFAATDSALYDVTAATAAPVVSIALSGATGAGRMTSTMFSNTAGSFLAACSHEGGYFTFDGASWTKRVSGEEEGKVSGVDPDRFVFTMSWKRKLWFVEKDSTDAWYLPTDQITGEARRFPLGSFAKNGGKLSFITSWTIDAGEGIDDLIAFVFEGGDVLIYKGTDPDSAATFGTVGNFYIGAIPTGRRCFGAYGGDVLITSELGVQPLSYVTRGGQSMLRAQSIDFLAKIQPRIAELVSRFARQPGWEIYLHAKENLLIVNVPSVTTGYFRQYALYTNTNAWCMFEGMPIRCAKATNGEFWFGTEVGTVCKGFSGYFDGVPYGSNEGFGIQGLIRSAYSYFGAPGRNKHFLMLRPTFISVDTPGVDCGVTTDFAAAPPAGLLLAGGGVNSVWDTAIWDDAKWAGSTGIFQQWYSVQGIGYTGSAFIHTKVLGDTTLASLDYIYEYGGAL